MTPVYPRTPAGCAGEAEGQPSRGCGMGVEQAGPPGLQGEGAGISPKGEMCSSGGSWPGASPRHSRVKDSSLSVQRCCCCHSPKLAGGYSCTRCPAAKGWSWDTEPVPGGGPWSEPSHGQGVQDGGWQAGPALLGSPRHQIGVLLLCLLQGQSSAPSSTCSLCLAGGLWPPSPYVRCFPAPPWTPLSVVAGEMHAQSAGERSSSPCEGR